MELRPRLMVRRREIAATAALAMLATVVVAGSNDEQLQEIRSKYRQAILWGVRGAPEIEVGEALELAERDRAILVDARTDEERAVSVIAGAITTAELAAAVDARPRSQVIVYCTIGARSATATRRLRRQGIEARNLVGGVLAWAHAGGRFERNGAATTTVHVYGPSWNLLPDGYQAVW